MIDPTVFGLVGGLFVVTAVGIVGVWWFCVGRRRIATIRTHPAWLRRRLRAVAPFGLGLGVVLVVNKGLQGPIRRFSARYGFEATSTLYAIEGELIRGFQSSMPEVSMLYFSAVYTVGYAVLLVAPLCIYVCAEQARPIKLLVSSYAINYAVAVVCYAGIVAYGPRNVDRVSSGTAADSTLLELVPEITVLTSLVNSNTNVFPSLHASLSVTVLLVAVTTRTEFRRWYGIALALAVSIVVATMALGIHWLLDVVAGILLAIVAVGLARWLVDRSEPL